MHIAPTLSRRQVVSTAASSVLWSQLPAIAATKKPMARDLVEELDARTPKDQRNGAALKTEVCTTNEEGIKSCAEQGIAQDELDKLKKEFFPQISYEGLQGQGQKVVYSVPHENLGPPLFSSVEFMWIKDADSGKILSAKKLLAAEPNLVITAFGNSGQKLTAGCKDSTYGIWEGTFRVP